MSAWIRPALLAAAALALLLVTLPAVADEVPRAVTVSELDGAKRILVAYDDGVVAFDADGRPYHAYRFAPGKQGRFQLADVDRDGKLDYVALGPKATFVIGAGGDPIWAAGGCDVSRLGNIAGDEALEVFCIAGRSMRVWASDGSLVWEMELSGMSFGDCRLVDLRGAGMGDIECQLSGKKMWLQVSGEGELIDEAADAPSDETLAYALPALPPGVLDGGEGASFDFDGDGRASERVSVDGGEVVVEAGDTPLAVVTMTPAAAAAGDLDGDPGRELVLAAAGRLVALDPQAEKTVRFDTAFERGKLTRQPVVTFGTLGTYGLAGDEAALRTVLEASREALADCYTARLKKDDFLKVGRLSVRAMVGPGGKVDKVEQSFSTLGDTAVEACVAKVVGGLTLPAPADGAEASYGSIDLVFGYLDQ